jgi:DNA-binding response OmpR family regulator
LTRVLVVDDDVRILRALALALTRAGFDVTTAEDAAPAIAMSESTVFDIVLADYHMRASCGIDVVRHYKRRLGDQVFCAILSGEDSADTTAQCAAAGADMVMCKPVSPTDLREQLLAAARSLRRAS